MNLPNAHEDGVRIVESPVVPRPTGSAKRRMWQIKQQRMEKPWAAHAGGDRKMLGAIERRSRGTDGEGVAQSKIYRGREINR